MQNVFRAAGGRRSLPCLPLVLVFAAMLLASCSKDSESPPVLIADPSVIQLAQDDSTAAFDVRNTGGGTLDWELVEDAPWLLADPTAGSTSSEQRVDLMILADSLSNGQPTAFVSLASNGGSASVTVRMWRALSTEPTRLALGSSEHGEVLITNQSDNPIAWLVTPLDPWLEIAPREGLLDDSQTLAVTILPSGLSPGEHVGAFVVSAGALGADSIEVTISVPQVASVSGHIYYQSTTIPVPEAIVSIGAIIDTTDVAGAYLLANVPSGTRTLHVEREGFETHDEEIEVPTSGLISDVTVSSEVHAHPVSGFVRNSRGDGLSGAEGVLLNPDDSPSEIAVTAADDGSYTMAAVPEGLRRIRWERVFYSTQPTEVQVSGPTTHDPVLIALPLPPPYLPPPERRLSLDRTGCLSVLVGWQPRHEPTAGGYRIERARSADGPFVEIGRVSGGETGEYLDQIPDLGHYNYRVRTENIDGLAGDATDPEYSGITLRIWAELNDGTTQIESPDERFNHTLIYDQQRNRVILFAGVGCVSEQCGIDFNDTWALDLETREWVLLDSGTGPGERQNHVAIWDELRDRMVVFGGWNGTTRTYYNDVWSFDLDPSNSDPWTRIDNGLNAPAARYGQAGIYTGPADDRLIIYGGRTRDGVVNDVWSFDLATNTWTRLLEGTPGEQDPQPYGRYDHGAIYDQLRHRLVFNGGRGTIDTFDDTWALDLTSLAWTQLPDGPNPRSDQAAIYDAPGDRMIVIEGRFNDLLYDDIQALSLGEESHWEQLDAGGEFGPGPRHSIAAAYDTAGDRLVIFGGQSGGDILPDTWAFCVAR